MKNRSFAKMFAQFWITLVASVVLVQSSVYADGGGGSDVGGGGDASEVRVNEIRSDILSWIQEGGARALTLPRRITLERYVSAMTQILTRHTVIIGFVTTEQENQTVNPELKVMVDDQPKTCRGFISEADRVPHILCNIERFSSTPPADQYRLIHHEYAGLAQVERNLGASSDYEISEQITDYLVPVTVLRLSVRNSRFLVSTSRVARFGGRVGIRREVREKAMNQCRNEGFSHCEILNTEVQCAGWYVFVSGDGNERVRRCWAVSEVQGSN